MTDWNQSIKLYYHDRLFRPLIEPLVPAWVSPNHITVFRICLTPVVVYFLAKGNYPVGVPLFLIAALSDALDGMLARWRRQITEWGIIYDPLADKLLIGSVLVVIVLQHVNATLGWALIAAEIVLIIGGLIYKKRKDIQPANVWGKLKMVAEVVGIMFLLVALWSGVNLFVDLSTGTLVVALIAAIISIFTKMI